MAYLLLRVTLGMNICLHGVTRIAAGLTIFAHSLVPMFQKTILPPWSVYVFGLTLPWAEAILGGLILVGLRTRAALIGGALTMLMLTLGTALRQDWQIAGLQLIYSAVYAVLLARHQDDLYSLDTMLWNRR